MRRSPSRQAGSNSQKHAGRSRQKISTRRNSRGDELKSATGSLSEFSCGVVPDAELVAFFDDLFSPATTQYAYMDLTGRDPLAGSVTGRRGPDLWSAWRTASAFAAQSRPLDATRRLHEVADLHPVNHNADYLAEAERLNLLSECLSLGHQYLAAIEVGDSACRVFLRFLSRLESDASCAALEIAEMVETLAGIRLDPSRTAELAHTWAATRGLDFVLALGYRRCQLAGRVAGDKQALKWSDDLFANARLLHVKSGVAFGLREVTQIEFALGNCRTEAAPDVAFFHFEAVVRALGMEDGRGLRAAINAANCLLRCGRFAEAEDRYASLESLFELRGQYCEAARVWMSECIAKWKRKHDPAIRHDVIGAIKLYEGHLPKTADHLTRYAQKQFIEQAYLLLVTANCHNTDYSDARLDEVLSALWALYTRDLLASLEQDEPGKPWDRLLARQQSPLAGTRNALAPFRSLGVVHLLAGIDCTLWIIYGFDGQGDFRFAWSAAKGENAHMISDFLRALDDQLEADKIGDALAVQSHQHRLETLAETLSASLSPRWVGVLQDMTQLFYMPHSFGNVDEFPLGALRFNGRWLAELVPIVRSPSITHLRETLSPSRARVNPQPAAVVVLGSLTVGGPQLKSAQVEAATINHLLGVMGFSPSVHAEAGAEDVKRWCDGASGVLHYIGHGIANEVFEALPLAHEDFGPLDADKIDGFRVPFLFFCACLAGRVRYGAGGYSVGLASKLIERGGPAAIAFSMPIPENRAYSLARQFYRQANNHAFGKAVLGVVNQAKESLPAYAWLALAAYGDPAFELSAMCRSGAVPMLHGSGQSWHSHLRNHCVLRTNETRLALEASVAEIPFELRSVIELWLRCAFQEPPAFDAVTLEGFEQAALGATGTTDVERLSFYAAVCAERLHASGLEKLPIAISPDATSIRQLLDTSRFLAVLGSALFDMRLNGLGCSFMGRVITVDQNGTDRSALFLCQGREKLLECESVSPFVRTMRCDDGRILQAFGARQSWS